MTSFPSSLFNTKGIQSLFFNLCRHVDEEKQVAKFINLFDSMTVNDNTSAQELASDYFFERHCYSEATTRLQSLLASNSLTSNRRMEVICKLVLSCIHSSPSEAIHLAQQLPDVDIVDNVDMNELEEMLKRRDFLKKTSSTATATAASAAVANLSPTTTPREAEMEEEGEPEASNVVLNIRKIV